MISTQGMSVNDFDAFMKSDSVKVASKKPSSYVELAIYGSIVVLGGAALTYMLWDDSTGAEEEGQGSGGADLHSVIELNDIMEYSDFKNSNKKCFILAYTPGNLE